MVILYLLIIFASLYWTYFLYRLIFLIFDKKVSLWILLILFVLILYLSRFALQFLELKAVIYYHVFVVSLILEIFYLFLKKYKVIKYVIPTGLLCILIVSMIFGYGYYRMHHIIETTYTINSEKIDNLDIAVIADLHMGVSINQEKLKSIVKEISQKNVDIIVLDGDIFDENTTYEDMKAACQILGSIHNKMGIYYVYGNHDGNFYTDSPEYSAYDIKNELLKNNIIVLEDEVKELDSVILVGRKDARFYNDGDRLSMSELIKNQDDRYMIVLDHQPLDLDINAKLGCDLQIFGHTHGGQLFPQGIIQSLTSDTLVYGKREIGDLTAITTSGISGWRYPIKTGAPSEYVIIHVR
ncbi:MAG: metallophosphoesterase [Faecalibacillus sp.]